MFGRLILAILLGLCVAAPLTWAGSEKKDSANKVQLSLQTFPIAKNGQQKIVIYIDIQKGHYIYANPVNNEMFTKNATVVSITTPSGKPAYKVLYPEPVVKRDEFFGAYDIYKGKVSVTTIVQRTNPREPLRFNVRVNACTENKCWPTGTIPFTVK